MISGMTNDEYDEDILGDKVDGSEADEAEPSVIGDTTSGAGTKPRRRLTVARATRVAHRVAAEIIRWGMADPKWSELEGFSEEENRMITDLVTGLADQHSFRST